MILAILDKHDEVLGRLNISGVEWRETDGIRKNVTPLMVPIDRSGMPVAARLCHDGGSALAPLEGLDPVRYGDSILFDPGKLRVELSFALRVSWQA